MIDVYFQDVPKIFKYGSKILGQNVNIGTFDCSVFNDESISITVDDQKTMLRLGRLLRKLKKENIKPKSIQIWLGDKCTHVVGSKIIKNELELDHEYFSY